MKIADFFIALGFEVKGKEDVEKVDRAVVGTTINSLKLLAGVTALNAAFYAMIAKAVEAGVTLQKFALTTGLSEEELQRWQLTAVRGNAAAATMAQALGAIQKARAAIAFGNAEAAAPWMLLGIDPRQDPFKVLEQLRQQVLKLDPAIARQKLSEMGMSEDLLYLMRQPNFGRGNLAKTLTVTPEEANNLAKLGSAWKEFLFSLGQFATRFSAQFAEPLAEVLKQFTRFLAVGARFIDWLEGGSTGARYFMYAMLALLVVMTALGIAIPLLMSGPIGVWVAGIIAASGAIAYLVLRIQDLWVGLHGGKSAFSVFDNIVFLTGIFAPFTQAIIAAGRAWKFLVDNMDKAKSGLSWAGDILGAGSLSGQGALLGRLAMAGAGVGGDSTQTNHVHVTVAPGSNPHETGRNVGRGAVRQISDAYGQMPLPSK